MYSHALSLFLLAAGMQRPEQNIAECCAFGPAGIGAKPMSLTILDLVGSTSGAEKPMPSTHIAARPCAKLVWHSFQLKPIAPDGAVSRDSFLYSSAAQIASGVSISSVLPSADSVSLPMPSRIWVNRGTLAFFWPRPTK